MYHHTREVETRDLASKTKHDSNNTDVFNTQGCPLASTRVHSFIDTGAPHTPERWGGERGRQTDRTLQPSPFSLPVPRLAAMLHHPDPDKITFNIKWDAS